jgi:phosphate transport system substrate-binding protein
MARKAKTPGEKEPAMKFLRFALLPAFLLATLTPCFAHHMAVVVNHENPVATVSSTELVKIFSSETRNWPDGTSVLLILHKDSPGETETLQKLMKLTPSQWKSVIATHKVSIQVADSDAAVLKLVQSSPGAIGLVEIHSIDNTVKVVSVDGKLPMEFGYLPH